MSILVELVKEDFGISGSGRWYRSDVHSSLVVDAENDLFFFNSRELKGSPVDYLMKIRGLSKEAASKFVKSRASNIVVADHNLQTRFDKLVDLFHGSGKDNRKYWYDRLLTDSTIDRYRLGFFEDWSLIPIYDNGLFFNFQCRRDEPEKRIKFWYKDTDFRPVLFNRDILNFVDTIYIVEGMVDCLYLNQAGFPSVCSTNGALSWNQSWIKFFTRVQNVFYIADNDKAGISAAKVVANCLGDGRTRILRFKDKKEKYGALDFFREGGTPEQFKEVLNNQSIYGFEKELI